MAGPAKKGGINVTPLVDIVLVLLIIFMVATPLALRYVTPHVPDAAIGPPPPTPKFVSLEVRPQDLGGAGDIDTVLLDGKEIPRTELAARLDERLRELEPRIVFVDFDDRTRYSDVVGVMSLVHGEKAAIELKVRPN